MCVCSEKCLNTALKSAKVIVKVWVKAQFLHKSDKYYGLKNYSGGLADAWCMLKCKIKITASSIPAKFITVIWHDWRRVLKAPPVNPRDFISQTFKISLREGHWYVLKYVWKSSKNRKKVDNGPLPIKKGRQRCYSPDKCNIINSSDFVG